MPSSLPYLPMPRPSVCQVCDDVLLGGDEAVCAACLAIRQRVQSVPVVLDATDMEYEGRIYDGD